MKKSVIALLLALLLVLAGCASDVWGSENLLSAVKGQGTAFSDAEGRFTLTAPASFADVTAQDAEGHALVLEGDGITIRTAVKNYVQNLSVTGEEEYAQQYKELGMNLTSYTQGKIFGANGIKISGSYKAADGTGMQQIQYAFNQNGNFVVFTCSYPSENARAAKATLNTILGSFTMTQE